VTGQVRCCFNATAQAATGACFHQRHETLTGLFWLIPLSVTIHRVNDREYDTDIDRIGRVGGRKWVPREGRNEFMQPTSWNSARAALVIGVITVIGIVAVLIFF
jgi:hypothetical protein